MPTNSAALVTASLPSPSPVPRADTELSSHWYARRIPELDGLRGLAILLVLVRHFGYEVNSAVGHRWLFHLMDVTALSWSGVDLFFVLSGFLIGGILLDARNSPNYFKAFYARRVFRIIPIYAVVLGIFYLCEMAGLPGHLAGSEWLFGPTVPWYSYATFTQNFQYAAGGANLANWLTASWSLAVEEQFYLVLPLVIWFVSGRKLVYLLGGAILAAPLLRVWLVLNVPNGNIASFCLMPCRADGLLLGVSAAMLVRNERIWESLKRRGRWLISAWLILLAGLPVFIFLKQTDPLRSFWITTVGFSWLAFFYLGLLLLALIYSGGWIGRTLRNSWLHILGTISYGVYLIHRPVLGLTFAIVRGKAPWAEISAERVLVLVALALTVAIASVSWTFFEKPLLRIGHSVKY